MNKAWTNHERTMKDHKTSFESKMDINGEETKIKSIIM